MSFQTILSKKLPFLTMHSWTPFLVALLASFAHAQFPHEASRLTSLRSSFQKDVVINYKEVRRSRSSKMRRTLLNCKRPTSARRRPMSSPTLVTSTSLQVSSKKTLAIIMSPHFSGTLKRATTPKKLLWQYISQEVQERAQRTPFCPAKVALAMLTRTAKRPQ